MARDWTAAGGGGGRSAGRGAAGRGLLCVAAVALAGLAARGQGLLDWGWEADLERADVWQAQPGWQSDPAPGAECRRDGDALLFSVPDAGRGMKWSQSFSAAGFEGIPFLVLRYRAEGLATGSDNYLVYIEDRVPGETRPLRLSDAVADGQWHTLVRDLREVTTAASFEAVAVQVRAGGGPARLWVSSLRLAESPPEGAERAGGASEGGAGPPPADWWADLGTSEWVPRPDWLANPAEGALSERTAEGIRFRVPMAGKGMKWSWFPGEDFPLAGYGWLTLRYRASGSSPQGDYSVCVLGTASADGRDYAPAVMPAQLRHDGLWRVLTVPLGNLAGRLVRVRGFALQVQAAADDARLEVSRLGLTAAAAPVPALDYLAASPGEMAAPYAAVPVGDAGRLRLAEALRAENVQGWPGGDTVRVGGVPFLLPAAELAVPATGIRETGPLRLPVGRAAGEILLLVLGVFRGAEEAVYGPGSALTSIAEADRFRAEVLYADGTRERCFPCNLSAGGAFRVDRGAQALCVFADPAREAAEVVLADDSPGAAFVVAAMTCRSGPAQTPDPDQGLPDLARVTDRRLPAGEESVRRLLGLGPGQGWLGLWLVTVDGLPVPSDRFRMAGGDAGVSVYRCEAPPLELQLGHRPAGEEFVFTAAVLNLGQAPLRLALSGPRVGPVLLGDRVPEHQWYWFPCAGWLFGREPFARQARYGGGFPVQVLGAVNPVSDEGVYLRTLDTDCVVRDYAMQKGAGGGVSFRVDGCVVEVPPGGRLTAAEARLGLTGGDWRTGFRVYRDWLRTWYRPATPRQAWFREVFNFRQRFLHSYDPLYDARTGAYSLGAALEEGAEQFGGIEYLHLFDWGSLPGVGRVYGRIGDHSPLESYLKGGAAAFRDAIAGVQAQGVRVGLYIEGYLLEERGLLGQAHGKGWQIRQRDGSPMYWPASTEMMICSHVPAWRETQAQTYAARVRELGVDGMYLDQFGFANPAKDCWSPEHGHPVPGYAVVGEQGLSRLVRERVEAARPGVVLYGEESPCDVNSQYMDGSFTYHMNACRHSRPLAPLHPLRFAVPSFKTFEILVCDHPMGTWSEGVKWTFFNGEGIWLEGPARQWFAPHTLAAIRKCHALLREYRAAFTSEAPEPLAPTLTPGVVGNVFPGPGGTVMTLYNARHRSVVAMVPVPEGVPADAAVLDRWNGAVLRVRRAGGRAVVDVPMEPRDVGCVVFPGVVR